MGRDKNTLDSSNTGNVKSCQPHKEKKKEKEKKGEKSRVSDDVFIEENLSWWGASCRLVMGLWQLVLLAP